MNTYIALDITQVVMAKGCISSLEDSSTLYGLFHRARKNFMVWVWEHGTSCKLNDCDVMDNEYSNK